MIRNITERAVLVLSWTLTVMQVVTGCVFFSPGLIHLTHVPKGVFNPRMISILLFLGAGVTLGAFSLYNWAITRMPASTASAHINLIPVVAVGCGFVFLGESLHALKTTHTVLGCVVHQGKVGEGVPLGQEYIPFLFS